MLVEYNMQNRKHTIMILFNNISRDTRKLYIEANKLIFRKEALPLSDEKDPKTLAERFNVFLSSKMKKIMTSLVPTDTHQY